MTITLNSLNPDIQPWAQSTSTADVSVTLNGTARTLTGTAAAAYLFGQALTTVKFKEDTVPDGLQLNDGTFQFPPGSTQWVSLGEVADALRYKYGVDPLIEFAPGLGVRGYSVADINRVLELLNREFANSFKLSLLDSVAVAADSSRFVGYSGGSIPTGAATLLNTASTPILAGATETELRQSLTDGGDLYTDRFGAFYLNGVRTQAMDVAVTSRLLVQDNVSAEYKVLMDELAERNNLIAVARSVLSGGASGLQAAVFSLGEQYGMADVLSELTAGQFSDSATTSVYRPTSTSVTAAPAAGKVVFATESDPAWSSGTRVRAAAAGGGLTAGVDYFVRSLGSGQYSFFSSQTEATDSNSTGQIAITGPISGLMIPNVSVAPASTSAAFEPLNVDYSADSLGFNSDPGWTNGSKVRITQSGHNLDAGSDYFVERYTVNNPYSYRFYTDSSLSGTRVNLFGGAGSVKIYAAPSPSVTFTADPGWPDGTRVQASATGGGLTAGTDYFVRKVGVGQYSFFNTAAQAKSNSATGLVILTAPITASITNATSAADFTSITALLNTLISNKVRDGDLDQAKLQTLTAQLQNNTEAMTALIKAFTDMNAQLARAL